MNTTDRIAKRLSRVGIASRREAERMILAGRVAVNGTVVDTPAITLGLGDTLSVDGVPVPEPERPRLWMYHKPVGLVTTTRDEKGRPTVFDTLPPDLPRVMSIGRLDLNSEGLLLLTNDGGLKRRLELPRTGWVRKYRVRVNGTPKDADFAPLRHGLTIEDDHFQPIEVALDRQQGANAWLTIALREGKNREIRRALAEIGLAVNRLIRISFGPFALGPLPSGKVREIKPRILRDQLGLDDPTMGHAKAKKSTPRGGSDSQGPKKTRARSGGPRLRPRPSGSSR